MSASKQRDSSLDGSVRVPSWAASLTMEEAVPRSLECTSIEVRIVDTKLIDSHTKYFVRVSYGVKSWAVERRFTDFYYLDKELRDTFPNIKIPPLPPKRYILSSNDPRFVDERKEQLEIYLKALVTISHVWSTNHLVLFLDDESGSMMFIWNFERMRKIQDVK
jgi:hypothetical protein